MVDAPILGHLVLTLLKILNLEFLLIFIIFFFPGDRVVYITLRNQFLIRQFLHLIFGLSVLAELVPGPLIP